MNETNYCNLKLESTCVADYIINEINNFNKNKNRNEKISLTVIRLQRLLYLCEIEYMKKSDGQVLFEEDFYAWPSGPVMPMLYIWYSQKADGSMNTKDEDITKLDEEIKIIIDYILSITKNRDTNDLKTIINRINGLWYKVYSEEPIINDKIIPKDEMYKFYRNKDLLAELPAFTSQDGLCKAELPIQTEIQSIKSKKLVLMRRNKK